MPAERLGGRTVPYSRFDAVGADSDTGRHFVRHLALAAEGGNAPAGTPGVRVVVGHMGPPLVMADEMEANVIASLGLSADEAVQVAVFADEHALEHAARKLAGLAGYVVRPHASDEREADGTVTYRRFSCVGFVVEAYRDAGIDAVDTDEARVPLIDLRTVALAYPDLFDRDWQRMNARYRLGLDGAGPWPVLLAGHVVHALDRSRDEIRAGRYTAVAGDEYFPRRTAGAGRGDVDLIDPAPVDRPKGG